MRIPRMLNEMRETIDWNARWQASETPWDKGSAAPPLTDWFTDHPPTGHIIVPGCGSGHDVRMLAAMGATVLGIDLSEAAIRTANSYPKAGGETYQVADLFSLPIEWASQFDLVVEHTCFCAIDPSLRPAYVNVVHNLLRPTGTLVALFYMDPPDDDGSGPPFGSTPEELDALFGAKFQLQFEIKPQSGFDGRVGHELLRILTPR